MWYWSLVLTMFVGVSTDTLPSEAVAIKSSVQDSAWVFDKRHSQVQFHVPRLGFSRVTGRFNTVDMDIRLNPDDLASLQVSATIDVASIDTGIERRDTHLRSADFFDVESHPHITFVSTGIEVVDEEQFKIIGRLTMRGVTKDVTFHATRLGSTFWGDKQRLAFSVEATLDRMDYGVSWSELTDRGGIIIGNEVTMVLSIEIGEA